MMYTVTIFRLIPAFLLIVWCNNSTVGATIDVGYHALLPNSAGQQIEIMVIGGETVTGIDLFVQVGDGGPQLVNVGLPPGTNAPTISSADLLTATIFAGTPATQFDHDRAGIPQVLASGAALSQPPPATQSVIASGRLLTLTIDTSGFYAGTFDLALMGVLPSLDGGPFSTTMVGFNGSPVTTQIVNGTIEVTITRNGDYNQNGTVDAADYAVWRDSLGLAGPSLAADGDGNQHIDHNDFVVWKNSFGTLTGPTGAGEGVFLLAVPEPSIISISVVAAVLAGGIGRRR